MRRTELAVVGAGPAGLAAAVEAARCGVRVTLVDENGKPGGQLFKQIHKFFGSREHRAGTRGYRIGLDLLAETEALGVEVLLNRAVYGLFEGNVLGLSGPGGVEELCADRIILATGAGENGLAFPGGTLPGVMMAGAAQTMVNIHRVLPGRRFLMIGSGNVGLIVTYQLLQAGAEVVAVVEAAPKIGGYGVHSSKVRRAGVPILLAHTVKEAGGKNGVEWAVVCRLDEHFNEVPGSDQLLEVDSICLAVGLTPLTELARMAGCRLTHVPRLGGFVPLHDGDMMTTVDGVYVAGDITGVEEASTAMEEGRLAGLAAAQSIGRLGTPEAEDRKGAVRERIAALRTGPFGEHRRLAKADLVRAFAAGRPAPAAGRDGEAGVGR